MSDSRQIGCASVILAAGASTRLGQPKQLLRIDGESLLHRTIRMAAEAGYNPIFVVLGYESDRMRQDISGLRSKIVLNPEWQSGMGSSLRCGITALMKENPLPERTLLLLSDQAKLSAGILSELMQRTAEGSSLVAASRYAGRLGVPAIFRKDLYPELLKVEGDQGARSVIEKYSHQTAVIDFPEGSVDIDTPQDLLAFQS
jgi:molybdenum cofactor cytidylyltransferase